MLITEEMPSVSIPPEVLARFARLTEKTGKKTEKVDLAAVRAFLDGFQSSTRILNDEPMAKHTSIKVGGPADFYIIPDTKETLIALWTGALERRFPFYIHGAGSNTLARDGGIRGIVLALGDMAGEIRVLEEKEEGVAIEADAGVPLHALVKFAAREGLKGLAHLAGIPASVGGALAMNAGVPKGTVSDCMTSLLIANTKGTLKTIPKENLSLSYRKTEIPGGGMILAGRFFLERGPREEIEAEVAETMGRRRDKQPLDLPNMGSVYMNPTEDEAKLAWGKRFKASALPSAGQLIEEAGLKGVRVGGARISEKHANFIVNEGEASAEDVQILMRLIKDKVKESAGIVLKPEVKVIGEEKS